MIENLKKISLICSFLILTISVYSQQNEIITDEKGDFFAKTFFGVGTLEAKDNFKVNANYTGGSIGKVFLLDDLFTISVAIQNLRVSGDYASLITNNLFLTNSYLQVPVTAGIREKLSENTSVLINVGSIVSYLYKSKLENIQNNIDESESGLGTNFGVLADVALKHHLNDRFSLSLGFKTQAETFKISDGGNQEFSLNEMYAFELGVGIKL